MKDQRVALRIGQRIQLFGELPARVVALGQRGGIDRELRWIAAHSGNRWNEYADSLATAYRRTKR